MTLIIDILKTTSAEMDIINNISARAAAEYPDQFGLNRWQLSLDVECVHSLHPLDLEQFLAFGAGDFAHDITGIYRHWNRQTLELENCFSPRCTVQAVTS